MAFFHTLPYLHTITLKQIHTSDKNSEVNMRTRPFNKPTKLLCPFPCIYTSQAPTISHISRSSSNAVICQHYSSASTMEKVKWFAKESTGTSLTSVLSTMQRTAEAAHIIDVSTKLISLKFSSYLRRPQQLRV